MKGVVYRRENESCLSTTIFTFYYQQGGLGMMTPLDRLLMSATDDTPSLQIIRNELEVFGGPCWDYSELKKSAAKKQQQQQQRQQKPNYRRRVVQKELLKPSNKTPIMKVMAEEVERSGLPIWERCKMSGLKSNSSVSIQKTVRLPDVVHHHHQTDDKNINNIVETQRSRANFLLGSMGSVGSGGSGGDLKLPTVEGIPHPPHPPPGKPPTKRLRGVHHIRPYKVSSDSLSDSKLFFKDSPGPLKSLRQYSRRLPVVCMKQAILAPLVSC